MSRQLGSPFPLFLVTCKGQFKEVEQWKHSYIMRRLNLSMQRRRRRSEDFILTCITLTTDPTSLADRTAVAVLLCQEALIQRSFVLGLSFFL